MPEKTYDFENCENGSQLKNYAFDTAIAAKSIADTNGVIIEANASFLKMWGYHDKSEVIGKSIESFLGDNKNGLEILGILNNSDFWEDEYIARKTDGSTFIAFGFANRLSDEQGNFIGYQSSVLNITGRKEADKKLLEVEKKYRSLMEQSFDMIYLYDLQGNFVDVNQASISHTGYSREEFLSMNVFDLHLDQSLREEILQWFTNWRIGESVTLETTLFRKDGNEFPVEIKMGKVSVGEKDFIMGLVRDTTKRKQTEHALKLVRDTLERRIEERTELAETRAAQLQFLAVELIEAEEKERQRIAELLHDDLQQILASAKMQLQMVCHAQPAISGLTEIDKLLKECISKSRSLSHELSPVAVYHSGLLNGLKWLSGQLKEQFGLTVHLEAEEGDDFESKPLKLFLFRAVQELLFNVIKHAGVDSAHVALSTFDSGLDITVTDKGAGFNSEIMNSSDGKSGLGLLSLRERVKAMGGSLMIHSIPGEGSIITMKVPLSLPTTKNSTVKIERRKLSSPFKANEPSFAPVIRNDKEDNDVIRVLFVDDHKVMRQGLINLITNQPGISVIGEAATGRQAVEKARRLQPDIVVMDVSMPEMDGIEATRRIKADFPDMRIISLSMYEEEHIIRTMRKAGAEAFISKSGSSAELLKAIYSLARKDKQKSQPVKHIMTDSHD